MKRRPRGHGSIKREGTGFSAHWREGQERCYQGGFPTYAAADNHITVARAAYLARRGRPVELVASNLTLADHATGYLARRKKTHEAGPEDAWRWGKHVAPQLGHLRPDEVDAAELRRFIHNRLEAGASPGSIRGMVSLLSGLYEELVEDKLARVNPCRGLPAKTRALMKSDHDPEDVPYLERLEDVRRVFIALRDQADELAVGYALGAFAGLRPGEAFGIRWRSVDLTTGYMHIREQATKKRVKSGKSRTVPILDSLRPVLTWWKVKTGGQPGELVVPPLRIDGEKVDKGTRNGYLRAALEATGLARPGFGRPLVAGEDDRQMLWYWCTRHTFASLWVLEGKPIEVLSKILGHHSIAQTEVYAHLRPDLYGPGARDALRVDLLGTGKVLEIDEKVDETAGHRRRNRRNS